MLCRYFSLCIPVCRKKHRYLPVSTLSTSYNPLLTRFLMIQCFSMWDPFQFSIIVRVHNNTTVANSAHELRLTIAPSTDDEPVKDVCTAGHEVVRTSSFSCLSLLLLPHHLRNQAAKSFLLFCLLTHEFSNSYSTYLFWVQLCVPQDDNKLAAAGGVHDMDQERYMPNVLVLLSFLLYIYFGIC